MVTFFLMCVAIHINIKDISDVFENTMKIFITPVFILSSIFAWVELNQEEKEGITIIFAWSLSILVWTYNLFKSLRQETPIKDETKDNEDLIGGWYAVDSKYSWFPVWAFEPDYSATYYDGKSIKEYKYHICCNTCIILTSKDGEKMCIERVWIEEKPHLVYNEQAFTQDGKSDLDKENTD